MLTDGIVIRAAITFITVIGAMERREWGGGSISRFGTSYHPPPKNDVT